MESFFTQMMSGLRLACVLVPKLLHNKSSASDSLQNCVEFGACLRPPTQAVQCCSQWFLYKCELRAFHQSCTTEFLPVRTPYKMVLSLGHACLFASTQAAKKIKRFSVSLSFTKWYWVWGMLVCLLASMQAAKKKKKEPKSFSASDLQSGVNLDGACLLTCKLHKFSLPDLFLHAKKRSYSNWSSFFSSSEDEFWNSLSFGFVCGRLCSFEICMSFGFVCGRFV